MHVHVHVACTCGASASPAHGHAPLLTARQHAAPLLQHTYASGIGSVNSVTRGMRRRGRKQPCRARRAQAVAGLAKAQGGPARVGGSHAKTALTAPHLLAPHRAHLTAHRIRYIPPTFTLCRRVRRTTSRGMLSRRTGPTDEPCGLGGSGIAWTPAGWSSTCCSWSRSSPRHLHAYALTKAQPADACCILPCISSCGLAPPGMRMPHPSSLLTPT